MMINYDQSVEINHNTNSPKIPEYLYKILIIGGLGSGKTNALLILIKINGQILTKLFICQRSI